MFSLIDRWTSRKRASPLPGPVVIGGVGGSGTRLLAEALQESGFYIGGLLNPALDNLWYTLLLRRGSLFPGAGAGTDREIRKSIELFETAMTRGLNGAPRRGQRHLIRRALEESIAEESRDKPNKARKSLVASAAPDPAAFQAWGWKEPNTHIHLEALARAFPGMKYALLIRNGLDMAFSRNRVQLNRWGPRFGVEMPGAEEDLPSAALRYWVLANRRAIGLGERMLGERFLVVNYDALCHEPETHMNRFLDFAGAEVSPEARARLATLPKPPESMGRYRRENCSRLRAEDIEAVAQLGFDVQL